LTEYFKEQKVRRVLRLKQGVLMSVIVETVTCRCSGDDADEEAGR